MPEIVKQQLSDARVMAKRFGDPPGCSGISMCSPAFLRTISLIAETGQFVNYHMCIFNRQLDDCRLPIGELANQDSMWRVTVDSALNRQSANRRPSN